MSSGGSAAAPGKARPARQTRPRTAYRSNQQMALSSSLLQLQGKTFAPDFSGEPGRKAGGDRNSAAVSRGSLSKGGLSPAPPQLSAQGAALRAVESYDSHKLAQRLLVEEHLMALEA